MTKGEKKMNEDERDPDLDNRIKSWLQAVVAVDDYSLLSKPKEDSEKDLGRPCMNCSMRGRRFPPNLRKMQIPAFVLGRPSPKRSPNRPPLNMQGVRQHGAERGKGRGRRLQERERDAKSTDSGETVPPRDAVMIVEMAQLRPLVDGLTGDDLARLRCASSYAREAKNDNARLKKKLLNPPKEVSVPCWISLIEMLTGQTVTKELVDFPINVVVRTCVAFETDVQLRDVLLKKMNSDNVALVMAYLAENSWLSTSSGELVCDFLDELGVSTDFALDIMKTASGNYDSKELNTFIQSMMSQSDHGYWKQNGDYFDFLTPDAANVTSKSEDNKGFGCKPKQKKLEIKCKEEFPDLLSTVTVKKNINTTTKNTDEKRSAVSHKIVSGSEGVSLEESETSSTTEVQGRHLTIFNLPDITIPDLKGALSAYGEVIKVEKCGQATKIWFEDPDCLDWAEAALDKINPKTGEPDESISCVVIDTF